MQWFRSLLSPHPSVPDPPEGPPIVFLGLGNPGEEHAGHRHNIGAQCVSLFARHHRLKLDKNWPRGRMGQGLVEGRPFVLARPRTFMNQSGLAARSLLERLGIPPKSLVVLCDEMDLPQGTMRIRPGGSSAGHRGLTSVEEHLGTRDYGRIRIGIGRPYPQEERRTRGREDYEEGIIRWVLGEFSAQEEEVMGPLRQRVTEAMRCILLEGVTVAMNRFN